MKICYRAEKRKPLVEAISEFTGTRAVYQFTPTYAYKIGEFIVDREGNVNCPDDTDPATVSALKAHLAKSGFTAEESGEAPAAETTAEESPAETAGETNAEEEKETPAEESTEEEHGEEPVDELAVSIPLEKVQVGNLTNLLTAKGALISKALGIEALPIRVEEDRVEFPWFKASEGTLPETVTKLIEALCKMSREQKRISAAVKTAPNEKYAFRCFLLRLGFIGKEYKADRKLLLKNFSGSSAFKTGRKKVIADAVSE